MVGVREMFRAPGAVACCEGVAEAKDPQSFGYWRGHFGCCVSWKRNNEQRFYPSERRLITSYCQVSGTELLAEIT